MKWAKSNCTKKALDEEQTNGQKHTSNASTQYQGNKTFFDNFVFYYYQLATFPNQGCMYLNKNSNNFIV
jgi:hypothetical protein